MVPGTRRAQLLAEIAGLQRQQVDDLANEMFCGWTREQEAAHQERSERLSLLVQELDSVDRGKAVNVRIPASVRRFPGPKI